MGRALRADLPLQGRLAADPRGQRRGEVNRILRDRPEGYRRWPEVEEAFGGIGFLGVFSVEGDIWRRQRRLSVTALNTNHLHRRFDAVQTSTRRLRARLDDASKGGEPVDIGQVFASYTLDVTSMLAFGHDLDAQRGDDAELQLHIQRAFRMLSFGSSSRSATGAW